MASRNNRDAILDAALQLSAARGFDAVSTAEVCHVSGTTNGSLFHFFPTKDDLHAALYLRAFASYQDAIASGLLRSSSARDGVRGLVLDHIGWVVEHPREARLLREGRRTATAPALADELQARNRDFLGRIVGWLDPHVAAGAIRRVPVDVLVALVFGPVDTMTRDWMRGTDPDRLLEVAPFLADAAWAALSPDTRGRARRSSRRAPAARSKRTKEKSHGRARA